MSRITRVRYDGEETQITDVMLDTGETVPISQAIEMCEHGRLEGVNVGATRNGFKTLRSNRDNDPTNNLSELPRF